MSQIQDKRGILFIISAPSGAGKTTLVRTLRGRDPNLHVSVSHTTRPARPDEIDGQSYNFIDEATFRDLIERDRFLEFAKVFDHHYGTSRDWVEQQLASGKDVILEIDWQGASQVRRAMQDAVTIFILPPSFETLEKRLQCRGEDETTVNRRMRDARIELSHYREYDYIVINETLDRARLELETIIRAMRHNYALQTGHYDEFAEMLMEQSRNIE